MLTASEILIFRKSLRMSYDKFAGHLGLTGKHRGRNVSAWEKGYCRPSKENMQKLVTWRNAVMKVDGGTPC